MDFTKIARALIAVTAFTAACVLQTGAAAAKWLRAESPNFIVYGNTNERVIREKIDSLETLDAALRLITQTKAAPSPNKLRVYLVSKAELAEVRPNLNKLVAGFYTTKIDEIAAFSSPGHEEWLSSQTILQHEYIHHFMLQYFPAAYPSWYVEGFAEYLSTLTYDKGELRWGMFENVRAYTLVATSWTSMEKVFTGQIKSQDQTNDLYAQGWLAVHFFYSKPERRKLLDAYMRAVVAGEKDLAAAFQKSTGMTFAEFDKELRKYMRGRLYSTGVKGWTPPAWETSIRQLTAGEAETLLLRSRIMTELSERERQKTLAVARKLGQDMPEDPHVRLLLAQAEVQLGDPQAALSLLAAAPVSAEAHYLRGRALHAQANADAAQSARTELLQQAKAEFARAHKLDGTHVGALYFYGSVVGELEPLSENTVNIFLLARELSPQLADTSLAAAGGLMRLGDFEEAMHVLEPVAYRPHGGEASEYAAYMMEAAGRRASLFMSFPEWLLERETAEAAAKAATASSTAK